MEETPRLITVVVDPAGSSRTALVRLLSEHSEIDVRHQCAGLPEALDCIGGSGARLCILGDGVPAAERPMYLRSLAQQHPQCALVSVCQQEDSAGVSAALQSGARAILFSPLSSDRVSRVLHSVLSVGREEQPQSLPTLLERVASRLQHLADQLRQEDAPALAASPEIARKALLAAVMSSDDGAVDFSPELLAELRQGGTSAPRLKR